jgi:citrate synthase
MKNAGVDVYTAVMGAVGALYGPLHGGANEAVVRMLQRIGSKDGVPAFVAAVKDRKEIMFGFGHRVYKNYVGFIMFLKKSTVFAVVSPFFFEVAFCVLLSSRI